MRQKPSYMNFTKLNSQRKKLLISDLENAYGFDTSFLNEYQFYLTSKDKIMLSKVDIDKLDIEKVNSLGIYFGIYPNERTFRLSLEGSKMIKPTKNFITLDENAMKSYVAAENLFENEVTAHNFTDDAPFKIVQFEDENLGVMSHREKEYLTYLPKSRKLDYNKVF